MPLQTQEINRIKKACARYDLDYMEYDFLADDYQDIMRDIYKRAGVHTEKDIVKDFLRWDAMSEQFAIANLEQRVYIPQETAPKGEFLNILVLSFTVHDYSLAKLILLKQYKSNMMPQTHKALEMNRHSSSKIRIMWFMARKETTDKILRDLTEKHNLRPRIMRNSYARRDFIHYANGRLYNLSRKDFRNTQKKQRVLITEQSKILESLKP